MSEAKIDILATVAYFDIFHYPLTAEEIFLFLRHSYTYKEFEDSIDELTKEKVIYSLDQFYSLQNDDSLILRRQDGNRSAEKLIGTAKKVSSILSGFPYVRGIAISGSLSKNFADKRSDIDLFIITAPNRVWIARTFMHCLKKLAFLVNKQHLFCMNYYIDDQTLVIQEKNIYTAIEIATLKPVYGENVFEQFYIDNAWFRRYLPNISPGVSNKPKIRKPLLKSLLEKLFDNRVGDMLDDQLMRITEQRWAKKTRQKKMTSNGIIMSMKVSRHFAKPDPAKFQNTLLKKYEDKIYQLLEQYGEKYSSVG